MTLLFTKQAATIFAPSDAGGQKRAVENVDAQVWGTEVEVGLNAALAGVGEVKGTWDASSGTFPGSGTADTGDAYLVTTAGTTGGVSFSVGDRIISITTNSSTSTYAGNWLRIPAGLDPVVNAVDSGAGTADAIQVVADRPVSVDGGQLIAFEVYEENDGTPVTLRITDGTGQVIDGLTIKTSAGNDPVIGALAAGLRIAGQISGGEFRLLSDLSSAAILAAAEAARDAALAAVPNAFPEDRTALKALNTATITAAYLKEPGWEGQFIWHAGDYSAQVAADTAEGIYIKSDNVAASEGAWVRVYSGAVRATWFGVSSNASPGDNVAALQVAAYMAAGGVLEMPPETIPVNSGVLLKSNTTVSGTYGVSRMIMDNTLSGTPLIDNAFFVNENWLNEGVRDHDILVENMVFDWREDLNSHVQVPLFARNVDRIKMFNCVTYEGHDLHAFVGCVDVESRGNTAYDCMNAPIDAWNSAGDIIFTGNKVFAPNRAPAQGIQVTGDDTDITTGGLLGTGHSRRVIISDNIIDLENATGTTPGIIVNCLSPSVTVEDVIIANNFVQGADFGITLEGHIKNALVNGNLVKDSVTQNILVFSPHDTGDGSDYAEQIAITNNLSLGDPLVHIDVQHGNGVTVAGNTIKSWSADNTGVLIREDVTDGTVRENNIAVNNGTKISNFAAETVVWETDWQMYFPTIDAGSGGAAALSAAAFRRVGKTVEFSVRLTITTAGTGFVGVELPVPAAARANMSQTIPAANESTAALLTGLILGSVLTEVRVYSAAGGYPASSGQVILVSGSYECA